MQRSASPAPTPVELRGELREYFMRLGYTSILVSVSLSGGACSSSAPPFMSVGSGGAGTQVGSGGAATESSGGAPHLGSGGASEGAVCPGVCVASCDTPLSPQVGCVTGQTCCAPTAASGGADSTTSSEGSGGASEGSDPEYDYGAAVENTGEDCTVADLAEAGQLPSIPKFPDPFKKLDGTRMTKASEWRCRRQEIRKQAEKYVYGEKPTPELVQGSVEGNKISVHVEDMGKAIDFSVDIVLPTQGQAPFPALINVGPKGGFGGISLGESRILEQGVAVIYYDHTLLGQEGTAEQSRGKPNPGKFYDIYGGSHSAGLLMAWAWGASRVIDVIEQADGSVIDVSKLGVTGCSRNGKGAFAIGLFDERIALTIPHETSTGGVPAYRIVDILNTERTDHNYFGLNWLSNNFEPFVFKDNVSNVVKLPIETHELVAMIAPRGLLVLENPHQRQMSAPAGYAASAAGAEVYKALGVAGNISYHSNVAETAHCSYKQEYTELLERSISKFLKHETDEPGEIIVGAAGMTEPLANWKDWETPTLEADASWNTAD